MKKQLFAVMIILCLVSVPVVSAFSFGEMFSDIGDWFKELFGKKAVGSELLGGICDKANGAKCGTSSEGICAHSMQFMSGGEGGTDFGCLTDDNMQESYSYYKGEYYEGCLPTATNAPCDFMISDGFNPVGLCKIGICEARVCDSSGEGQKCWNTAESNYGTCTSNECLVEEEELTTTCVDSDGGKVSGTKGAITVTLSNGFQNVHEDECVEALSYDVDGNPVGSKSAESCSGENCYVQEAFCREIDGVYDADAHELIKCLNGCEDGACKSSPLLEDTCTSAGGQCWEDCNTYSGSVLDSSKTCPNEGEHCCIIPSSKPKYDETCTTMDSCATGLTCDFTTKKCIINPCTASDNGKKCYGKESAVGQCVNSACKLIQCASAKEVCLDLTNKLGVCARAMAFISGEETGFGCVTSGTITKIANGEYYKDGCTIASNNGAECDSDISDGYSKTGTCQNLKCIALGTTVSISCKNVPEHSVICSGDSDGLTMDTDGVLVSSCTATRKCEFTCSHGYYLVNGKCSTCATKEVDFTNGLDDDCDGAKDGYDTDATTKKTIKLSDVVPSESELKNKRSFYSGVPVDEITCKFTTSTANDYANASNCIKLDIDGIACSTKEVATEGVKFKDCKTKDQIKEQTISCSVATNCNIDATGSRSLTTKINVTDYQYCDDGEKGDGNISIDTSPEVLVSDDSLDCSEKYCFSSNDTIDLEVYVAPTNDYYNIEDTKKKGMTMYVQAILYDITDDRKLNESNVENLTFAYKDDENSAYLHIKVPSKVYGDDLHAIYIKAYKKGAEDDICKQAKIIIGAAKGDEEELDDVIIQPNTPESPEDDEEGGEDGDVGVGAGAEDADLGDGTGVEAEKGTAITTPSFFGSAAAVIILIIVLVLAGGGVGLFFYLKHKNKGGTESKSTTGSQQTGGNDALNKYIADVVKKGFSKDQVNDKLLKSGWTQQQIDTAFNKAK